MIRTVTWTEVITYCQDLEVPSPSSEAAIDAILEQADYPLAFVAVLEREVVSSRIKPDGRPCVKVHFESEKKDVIYDYCSTHTRADEVYFWPCFNEEEIHGDSAR